MYKCHACGKQFLGGNRIDAAELWREYSELKQTYAQLAEPFVKSIRFFPKNLILEILLAECEKMRIFAASFQPKLERDLCSPVKVEVGDRTY